MKETPRESMVFYRSNMNAAQLMGLTPAQRCEFYEAVINYACCDEMPEFSTAVIKGLFVIAKANIDANIRKYDQRVKAVENGKKGGAPKGNQNAAKHKKVADAAKAAKTVAVPVVEEPAEEVPTIEEQSTEMTRPNHGTRGVVQTTATTVAANPPVSAARLASRYGVQVSQDHTHQKISSEIQQRYDAFRDTVKPYIQTIDYETLADFISYWTEPNREKTLMRFEMQKNWNLERKLTQWIEKRKTLRYYR